VATSRCERATGARTTQVFRSLERGEIPAGGAPAEDWGSQIDPDGRLSVRRVFPIELFPEEFQQFVRQVRADLYDTVLLELNLLRWRQGVADLAGGFADGPAAAQWSFDGEQWGLLPAYVHVILNQRSVIEFGGVALDDLESLLQVGVTQPIAHELLREARQIQLSAPRSALVMAVSALEVGTKQLISTLRPETQWLLNNLQSPPIHSLLSGYVPTLPFSGWFASRAFAIPTSMLEAARKMVGIRNDLVHKGRGAVDVVDLEGYLELVSDFLWLFDYLVGHEWASAYIRYDRRLDLGISAVGV